MPTRAIIDVPIDQIKAQILEREVTSKGIDELAASIKKIGVIEPLIVAKVNDAYILQAGKRRLIASRAAGLPTVPCIVLDLQQQDGFTITLHENMYRENLSPVDEAAMYQQLRDKHGYSSKEISHMIGQSEGYVSQRLQIIFWPDNLVDALRKDEISFSAARELAMINDTKHRNYLLKHAVAQGANYRTIRAWRIQWFTSTIPQTPDNTDEPPRDKPEPMQTEKLPCFWCNSWHTPDKIIMVKLCPDCFTALGIAKDKSHET
jgi:ParB/RepB/Spo0J family partition protein